MKYLLAILFSVTALIPVYAQPEHDYDNVDYMSQRKYKINEIKVQGNNTVDENAIRLISGLVRDQEISIPGMDISDAIRNLWDQKLFNNIQILQESISGNYVNLIILVEELPRLSRVLYTGDVTKGDGEKINDIINLYPGKIVSQNTQLVSKNHIRNFYIDKGYLNAKVAVTSELDTTKNNAVKLFFDVQKGNRFKINDIVFHGVESVKEGKLRRAMKETKRKAWWRIFKRSKYMTSLYESDKIAMIGKFNNIGLRDAIVKMDTVYKYDDKTINIEITVDEGNTYYFGDFAWYGNTKYRAGQLDTILGIKKGEVFNQGLLDSRLHFSQDGSDITSYYMDRGHLFFQLIPKEKIVNERDTNFIDYDVRISEGKIAYVRDVRVSGNSKTNDHVIYRELRTKPGDKFSRNDIIRTQRELNNLGYFNPETMGVNPIPNPSDGTVDIEYTVEEKPSDQIELSGGWGGGRVVGTLGLVFNNFALGKLFKGPWNPLPSGDGQRLSIRAQSNGLWYQSLNFSFTEPWLGGKKPNSLTVSAYHSVLSNGVSKKDDGREDLKVSGAALGLGRRNKWPDDFFQTYMELGYQRYKVNNYGSLFALDSGIAKSIYTTLQITRNSQDQLLYPTSGAQIKAMAKIGLPINSLLLSGLSDAGYEGLTPQERYAWVEYIKPKFTVSWFTSLSKKNKKNKLVLNAKTGFGFLLPWNKNIGIPPFERFYLGGSGLTGFNNLDGREIIAARGYDDNMLSNTLGSPIIAKYVMELRYPISLNPSATIFTLAFVEGSNTWENWKTFNPFQVKRAAGVGLRIFLPMFGMMGLDYGFGFDVPDNASGAQRFIQEAGENGIRGGFQFTIGMNLGDL